MALFCVIVLVRCDSLCKLLIGHLYACQRKGYFGVVRIDTAACWVSILLSYHGYSIYQSIRSNKVSFSVSVLTLISLYQY